MKPEDTNPVSLPEDSAPPEAPSKSGLASRRVALGLGAATAAALLGDVGALAQGAADNVRRSPLILRQEDLAPQTAALFKELKSNSGLQKEFIDNPSKLIVQRFLPRNAAVSEISPQRLSNANRVLYSVVANDEFREWAQQYQANVDKTGKVDKAQIIKDFSNAVIRYGDAPLLQGIMEDQVLSSENRFFSDWVVAADAVVLVIAFVVAVFAAVIFAATARLEGFTPGEFRSLVDQLVSKAKKAQASGELTVSFIR